MRTTVHVHPQQRRVEIISRVSEVVRIATEVRDDFLRRPHESHVVESAIRVERVDAAGIKRDYLTGETGALSALTLYLTGDSCSLRRQLSRIGGRQRGLDTLRHVLDRLEHVHAHLGAFLLVFTAARDETFSNRIIAGRRRLEDAIADAVVIRHHESIR